MYLRKNKKKVEEPIIDEVVEQKVHIDEISKQEDIEENENRWENSPYLKGLKGNVDESKTKLFEPTPEQLIPDDKTLNKKGPFYGSGLENDDQPQYPLPEEKHEERPNIIINRKSQILIGDDKGIKSVSDNPLIYGEFEKNDSDKVDNKPKQRTLESLSKKEYRYYLRTGRIPE